MQVKNEAPLFHRFEAECFFRLFTVSTLKGSINECKVKFAAAVPVLLRDFYALVSINASASSFSPLLSEF